MTSSEYYNYIDTEKDLTNKPANNHLIIEVDSDHFYFVNNNTNRTFFIYRFDRCRNSN